MTFLFFCPILCHYHTSAKVGRSPIISIGQIEIDEIYVGVNRHGAHFVIPVQAKAGSDQLGIVQTKQDIKVSAQ